MRPILLFAILSAAHAAALMPLPWKSVPGQGRMAITAGFHGSAAGCRDARTRAAAQRLENRIQRQGGFSVVTAPGKYPGLTAQCSDPASDVESYQLDISADGARLTARSPLGVLHGMETFAQLMEPSGDGFSAAAVHIEDHPRFVWRGLMLDVSRHWMPVEVVLRNLDAMAAVKLNVLHWHLADDQGFRVESKVFPKLHQLGSDGHFYTQEQVRQVIAYAEARGIRVVPEFDVPGHTTSWFVGYPELASAPGPYEIQRRWGIFEPTMDPSRESTFQFLDKFIGEMAALFTDPYFHIGGDEVEPAQWNRSAAVQAFAKEHRLTTPEQIQTYFTQRVQTLVHKHGKVMIGWDEIFAPGLSKDAVVHSWRGSASLSAAAKQGYRGILSAGYYLDHLLPTSVHYSVDPLAGVPEDAASMILGGEACMWSEYVSPETVDSRIWPRMAAIAERFWSPREVTDIASMYDRMEAVSRSLQWTGVQHRASYTPMLDRIGGGEPLRILANAVEAQGIEVRRDARRYSSLIDLNMLVDAARPESEFVRQVEQAVRRSDGPALRAVFTAWSVNDTRFKTLSKNLAATGNIGLHALSFLESAKPVPEKWIAEQERLLTAMAKPQDEVVLAAVRPVRMLLESLGKRTEQQ